MIEIAIFDETRRQLRDRIRRLPAIGTAAERARRLRSLLEEMDVHCDETAQLQDADAVLLASARGTEALVAARLSDERRLHAYARIIARLLVGEIHAPMDAKIEYFGVHRTSSRQDREEDAVVESLAGALIDDRLDAAPRPFYQDVPKLRFAFTPRDAARSTLGGFHQWSQFWYRRSNMYRRWRARRDVSHQIRRICFVLDQPRHA
jgi:hypothetical protein